MGFLDVVGVAKRFDGVVALQDVGFSVSKGQIYGIIGPNGAGKTTLFNVISGVYRPDEGDVFFAGEKISGTPLHATARRGIVRTFQLTAVFPEFTCLENVLVASHVLRKSRHRPRPLRSTRAASRRTQDWATKILDEVGLRHVAHERAGALPYGNRKALSVAIALAANPRLLLLDEPVSGMSNDDIDRMLRLLRSLREREMTIMIVEHNMNVVMELCAQILVLNFGRKLAEGEPAVVRTNKDVISAYLGSEED